MPDEPQPWYRTPGAVFTAGGVGLVLVIALVITIVQMSDQWSTPASTFAPPPVATTSATIPPGVTTPTPTTATTYPTTVSLSTTDINLSITPPSGSETSTSETSTPGTSTSGTSPPETTAATAETEDDEPISRTPRRTPRTNITRTLIPRPIN